MPNLSTRLVNLFAAILVSLCATDNSLANSNLAACMSMASQMNKSLTAKIDFLTTLQATSCLEDKGEVYFQYVSIISNPSALPRDVQAKAKAGARAQYCGNKDFRNALRMFDFDFFYVDSSRRPLHSFTLKASDC